MPTSPPPRRFRLEADPWRLTEVPRFDPAPCPLAGLTVAEAEAKLDQAERTLAALELQVGAPPYQPPSKYAELVYAQAEVDRLTALIRAGMADLAVRHFQVSLPSAPEQAPRPSLLARLWTRLRQAGCGHAAATAHRVPGFGPGPVFERRCGRCGATWSEYG